jgi:hypothetical protein
MKDLYKLMSKLEKDFEKINPKAKLRVVRALKKAASVQRRIDEETT